MIDLKLIADEISNTVIESNIVDQKQLSNKIKVLLELLLDRESFGPQLKVLSIKNQNMQRSISEETIIAKYWRDELRKLITEDQFKVHCTTINEKISVLRKNK